MNYRIHIAGVGAIFLTLFLAASSFAVAQAEREAPDSTFHRWALHFAVQKNFSLKNFQGDALSVEYRFDTERSIRIGLDGVAQRTSGSLTLIPDDASNFFRLRIQYIRLFEQRERLSFYWGGGFLGGGTVAGKALTLGAMGLLGVRWELTQRLSLHAEHAMAFVYSAASNIQSIDPSSQTVMQGSSKDWDFSPSNVEMGISVSF